MSYEFIVTGRKARVGVVTLNRPKQLNALSPRLMKELGEALAALDADAGIGAMKDFGYMASAPAWCRASCRSRS